MLSIQTGLAAKYARNPTQVFSDIRSDLSDSELSEIHLPKMSSEPSENSWVFTILVIQMIHLFGVSKNKMTNPKPPIIRKILIWSKLSGQMSCLSFLMENLQSVDVRLCSVML